MSKSITSILRGCGVREQGGLYVCSGLSPYGLPFSEFVIDPPLPFDGDPFRAPIVIEREGKKHLMLWVGAEYYPYVSDFLEEARRYGVSKRIPTDFPIEDLDVGSFVFLVHPRAIVEDHEYLPPVEYCPKDNPKHKETSEICCLGQSYAVAEPNAGINMRRLGSTEYEVYPCSMSSVRYEFKAGIFLRMPITHFDHIKKNGKINPEIAKKKAKLRLPLNYEDR